MGLTPLEKDVLVMDDKKETKKRIQIQRAFNFSRLGPELMSAAYESLVPIKRIPISAEKSTKTHCKKEQRQWAM
jgi:hypothetical protein